MNMVSQARMVTDSLIRYPNYKTSVCPFTALLLGSAACSTRSISTSVWRKASPMFSPVTPPLETLFSTSNNLLTLLNQSSPTPPLPHPFTVSPSCAPKGRQGHLSPVLFIAHSCAPCYLFLVLSFSVRRHAPVSPSPLLAPMLMLLPLCFDDVGFANLKMVRHAPLSFRGSSMYSYSRHKSRQAPLPRQRLGLLLPSRW